MFWKLVWRLNVTLLTLQVILLTVGIKLKLADKAVVAPTHQQNSGT